MAVRFLTATGLSCIVIASFALTARAQTPVTSIALRSDQIGLVKTAQALSTRISFPETVKEIICGDLYDPATGRGSFVVQRAENDVFIKPVVDKGMSNLFVKTGERSDKVYNFDLAIVSASEAVRVMNVSEAVQKSESAPADPADEKKAAAAREAARVEAEDIIRKARADADKMLFDAEQQARSRDRQSQDSAQKEIERRFIDAMMLGIRESKISNPRIVTRKVIVTLDPHMLTFDQRSYLRYTIQNTSGSEFSFAELGLEDSSGTAVAVEIVQSKTNNKLRSGESITGIIAFDAKVIANKGKVTLFVKGADQSEVARLAFFN